LHLPFPILSDEGLKLTKAMNLPTFAAGGMTLLKRFTLVTDDGMIEHVFYPVFPPDRNAGDVVAWLKST
jgi:peroxiredoxin (alkyl hydroperoxide reductase subunit C)